MFAKSLAVVVAASVLAVQAQTTTASAAASTPSLSPCLLSCVTTAASSAGCSSFTDLNCVCTSSTFQSDAATCLTANCTTADIQAAQALEQEECASITGSGSATATATGTATASTASTTSPSKTSTSTSGTSTATHTNAAAGLAPFAFEGFLGAIVASAGALLGSVLVL
ncbi:hypothetical protein BKA82DRAFT_995493 [Pisolithus tinctorius]|uniref:CFEM domain-containing protein n=1 Tax=Pisolithus tinctorius Marx 270 TaxID=870435 RepID=A0A0C3P9R9_PISTI|nr:hypothetical protein BKA82DRAFT_995493 [Pisolithus tinctorius]KIO10295.1 hypothetical protein M404DRAFT_995493 [Pisolithus tinctorius Marx 270]